MSIVEKPSRGTRPPLKQNAPQGSDVERERNWALLIERTRRTRRLELDALAAAKSAAGRDRGSGLKVSAAACCRLGAGVPCKAELPTVVTTACHCSLDSPRVFVKH